MKGITQPAGHPQCERCTARYNSVFRALSREEQERYTIEKGCMYLQRGQVLFTEGSKPAGLFCVNEGKFKLTKSVVPGRQQISGFAGEGDFLGYGTLLTQSSFNLTAEALEDSTVCYIPKDLFMESIMTNKGLMENIKGVVCKDVKRTENFMVEISQKQVRERLAQSILVLGTKFGLKEDNETLDVYLTREELASYVGTATESVIRIMSDFQRRGLIDLTKRNIRIKKFQKLRYEANLKI